LARLTPSGFDCCEPRTAIRAASNSILSFSFIGYHLANIFSLNRGYRRRFPQMTLALRPFTRKYVSFVAFVTFNFSGSGDAKSFRGGSISFDLRHE
jgi:hypothetical protein